MNLSRRKTLAILGGGVVLAASAGAGVAVTRTPQTAHLPWEQAGTYEEYRRRALSFALLAPNPHKPAALAGRPVGGGVVTLLCRSGAAAAHTDPYNRQITWAWAVSLKSLADGAAEDGYRVDLTLFPEGEDRRGLTAGRRRARSLSPIRVWRAIRCSRRFATGGH